MKKLESIAITIENIDLFAREAEELGLFEVHRVLSAKSIGLKKFMEDIFNLQNLRDSRRRNRMDAATKMKARYGQWLIEVAASLPIEQEIPFRVCPQLEISQRIRFNLHLSEMIDLPECLISPRARLIRSLAFYEESIDSEMTLAGEIQVHIEKATRENVQNKVYLYRLKPILLSYAANYPAVYARLSKCEVRCRVPKWMKDLHTDSFVLPTHLSDEGIGQQTVPDLELSLPSTGMGGIA